MFMKWWMESFCKHKIWLKRGFLLSIGMTLAISAAGCSLLPKEEQEEALPTIKPPTLSKKPEYTVTTQTLETKVRATGKLMSTQEETLYFIGANSESGSPAASQGEWRVKEVYVKSGDAVQKGQLIAEIDVTDMERQYRLEKLRFRKDYELPMIETLRNADQLDPGELEQKKIDFELQRQKLQDMQDAINNAKITAPFAGTVVSVMVQKGSTVQAYDPIALVADLAKLTVAAKFSAEDLQKVAVGMDAIVDINNAGQFKGKVKRLPSPASNANNNNNRGPYDPWNPNPQQPKQESIEDYLLVEIDQFPKNMARGTPLSVTIITNRKENAVVIPASALRTHAGRNYVQVVDKDGKREVAVEVGQQTSTLVEIVKGLQPGQKVVGR
ncbi:MAG TPA: efflux RND transporter periplasmic adaptor subunit [Bacilli bacterium]